MAYRLGEKRADEIKKHRIRFAASISPLRKHQEREMAMKSNRPAWYIISCWVSISLLAVCILRKIVICCKSACLNVLNHSMSIEFWENATINLRGRWWSASFGQKPIGLNAFDWWSPSPNTTTQQSTRGTGYNQLRSTEAGRVNFTGTAKQL